MVKETKQSQLALLLFWNGMPVYSCLPSQSLSPAIHKILLAIN